VGTYSGAGAGGGATVIEDGAALATGTTPGWTVGDGVGIPALVVGAIVG
jgi:hypothetical protein